MPPFNVISRRSRSSLWRDKVRCCPPLTLFQESPHQKLQNSASMLANLLIVDTVKYFLILTYVNTSNFFFIAG